MVRIYSAADIAEAHIVRGMLQAEGLDAHVGGHYLQGGIGELAAMDFASVYVDEDDLDRARNIIADYEAADNSIEPTEIDSHPSMHFGIPLIFVAVCILLLALLLAFV